MSSSFVAMVPWKLARLAPLHNRPNAQGIRIAAEIFPGKPQVAVFDTGFHRMLPPYAFHYPIPYEYYERHRVRRYGWLKERRILSIEKETNGGLTRGAEKK
jgi:acetate kinase